MLLLWGATLGEGAGATRGYSNKITTGPLLVLLLRGTTGAEAFLASCKAAG